MRVNLRDPRTRNLIGAVLLSGGMGYAFFGTTWVPFGWQPTATQIETQRAEFEKKSSDLARARQAVADLPRFQAEFAALHERYELAGEVLPIERELPGLLRKITLAGQQSGVQFELVRPDAPVVQDHYLELPINITVRGGYHQFGQFLAQLANMQRIVNVSNVRIASYTGADDDATCEASILATAYMMKPEGAAETPAAEGGKS